MGFVTNFTTLLITRIFLGITEAGLFPGVSFFLTQWYKRYGKSAIHRSSTGLPWTSSLPETLLWPFPDFVREPR